MRIGILSFSGARAAGAARDASQRFQDGVAGWLREQEHDVIVADHAAVSAASVAAEAERLGRADCDAVVFCFADESGPGLPPQAALRVSCPILLLGSADPAGVGIAALFAAAGAMEEVGAPCSRVLGGVDDGAARSQIEAWLRQHDRKTRQRGRDASQALYGTRCGLLGSGAPAGADPDPSQWLSQFGVSLERFGAADIAERARRVEPGRVQAGLDWLKAHAGTIRYDGDRLTPGPAGTLARQLRTYLAIHDLCREEQIAFCALADRIDADTDTGLILALLNDGNDWEGVAPPLVSAPGGDANGALTMQLLHLVTGKPALGAVFSHYHTFHDLADLSGGAIPPHFAAHAEGPADNWARVVLQAAPDPRDGDGASPCFQAAAAPEVTFARVVRRSGRFVCLLISGEFVTLPPDQSEALARLTGGETTAHAWARFHCPFEVVVRHWASSRIHAVLGDHIGAIEAACEGLDITPLALREASA